MVTTAELPGAPNTTKQDLLDRADALAEATARGARALISGMPNGQVRRNLLYLLTFALIIVGLPLAALLPLLLLALTDAVVIQ